MQTSLTKWGLAGLVGICLVSSLAYRVDANTGSAITGDGGAGNLDGSTFTGDVFAPIPSIPVNPETVSSLPSNWQCLRRAICPDCDLRLETLSTMLATNLSGTLTQKVIEEAAPRACCDANLVARAKAHEDIALLSQKSSNIPDSTESFRIASGRSVAALLEGVKPASLDAQLSQTNFSSPNASIVVAQAVLPSSVPNSGELNRFPIEAARISDSSKQLKDDLETALNLQSDGSDPAKTQAQKQQTLSDLVATLQGLTWEERLQNDSWQKHIDVDQLTSAIKNYNHLISLLNTEELNAWRNNRNGQDVTTVLKKLREGVTLR